MTTQTIDHDQFRHNVKNHSHWLRLIFMLLFAMLLHVAGAIMWIICALQFLFVLGTGRDNSNLRSLGSSLSAFIHQGLNFVSYNTEEKPFPFNSWPAPETAKEEITEAVIVEATVSDKDD
ncbi:DUF4389 domain-containing protein [Teredinibacter haidensis]|uniref:DUF4389 domain-containing protein n=1 Tax=Teredinibacter haidensis TaxID=2731755 RepID=UPI0009488B17|nr:DUF4389 domain-containing protein [Teredinibacter haidensis]